MRRAVAAVRARVLFWAPSEDTLRFDGGETT